MSPSTDFQGTNLRDADIAGMIDHALLSPTLTAAELDAGCATARQYAVASVCIMPYYLRRCVELLAGSPVRPSTTIGFPHGGQATATKIAETQRALGDGGQELDVVVNISQVLGGSWDYVRCELNEIIALTHDAGRKIKVIFENCYLADEHKVRLCELCTELGTDWVKTSTGFGTGGATMHDLQLMVRHTRPPVQVKAAGGIRDLDMLLQARALGVTRIGTSRTRELLEECRRRLGLPAEHHAARPARTSGWSLPHFLEGARDHYVD